MSDVLALDFTGAEEAARALIEELVAPDEAQVLLPTALLDDFLKRKRLPRRTHLLVVGAPPKDGIGYGVVPLLAVALRARTVTLLDARSRALRSSSLTRYVATSAPFAVSQLLGSGLALTAQRILASGRFLAATPARPPGRALHRMLYLFPSVGTPTSVGVGGGVSHAHGMLKALHDLEIAVDAFTSDPALAETAAAQADFPCRWNVIRSPRFTKALPASAAFGLDAVLAASTRAAAARCDLVYQRHARFSLVGALTARVAKLPFFLEFNSPAEFFHPRATLLAGQRRRCEDASLLAATRVFVVSTAAKRLLVERGVPEDRLVVNPNGVDPGRFSPGSRGSAIRRRLGFSADDVVLGFVGSFMAFHGVVVLAEAFVELAQTFPHARLLLVGEGDERSRVASILGPLIEQARVSMTGRVPPTDIPSYLAACDILVSPHAPLQNETPFFGSPTKLFEYMAAGRPIAASRLGQIAEVLEHERTALLVEPGDPQALAESLRRLLEDAELRARLGRAARSEALRYTWAAHAQRVVDEFQSLPQADAR